MDQYFTQDFDTKMTIVVAKSNGLSKGQEAKLVSQAVMKAYENAIQL